VPRNVREALLFLLGLWLALEVMVPLAARAESDLAALEADLARSVNAWRVEHHLKPLERRPDLDAVARAHSQDMARRGFFSHETPEGANWVDRLQRSGVEGFSMAGENVGLTSRAEPNREILNGWIHSPAHRENLEARPFNATGIGIARAANGTLYYTQVYLTFPR
jgi:uncharacterized protein YkwD